MSTERASDQDVLIDYASGELEDSEKVRVEQRLAADESFRKLHQDIQNTLQALSMLPRAEANDDLVARTLAGIRRARQTEALIAREEAKRRAAAPTFSLRELGVAAAAMVLIAVALVPSLRQARHISVAGQCASNVGQIGSGMLAYANANDDYLPVADGQARAWLPQAAGGGAFSNSSVLFRLIRAGYVSPTAFRCPAGGSETFQATADMTDFPASKYISYSYQHTLGPRGLRITDPQLQKVLDKMAILADSTPLFDDGEFVPAGLSDKSSANHGGRGQNVLFMDRHVEWAEHPDVGVNKDNIFLVEGVSSYKGNEEPASLTDTFLLPTFTAGNPPARSR
jgi:hypothetical protein